MRWKNKHLDQTTLFIEGIRCNHCESSIKFALNKIPGVRRVKISKRQQVMIEFDPDEMVSQHLLISEIQKAGYQPKDIHGIQ